MRGFASPRRTAHGARARVPGLGLALAALRAPAGAVERRAVVPDDHRLAGPPLRHAQRGAVAAPAVARPRAEEAAVHGARRPQELAARALRDVVPDVVPGVGADAPHRNGAADRPRLVARGAGSSAGVTAAISRRARPARSAGRGRGRPRPSRSRSPRRSSRPRHRARARSGSPSFASAVVSSTSRTTPGLVVDHRGRLAAGLQAAGAPPRGGHARVGVGEADLEAPGLPRAAPAAPRPRGSASLAVGLADRLEGPRRQALPGSPGRGWARRGRGPAPPRPTPRPRAGRAHRRPSIPRRASPALRSPASPMREPRRADFSDGPWFHLAQNAVHHAPNISIRKRIGAELRGGLERRLPGQGRSRPRRAGRDPPRHRPETRGLAGGERPPRPRGLRAARASPPADAHLEPHGARPSSRS